jgi:hypothetical protein
VKEPLLMWQRCWGKNLDAEDYIQQMLPVYDKFYQKNHENIMIEDNTKPYTADDCKRAKNSRL